MFEFVDVVPAGPLEARLKVFGVGGGGGNAVNNMIDAGLAGVEYIVANTDTQSLSRNQASTRLQIGAGVTRGLGAGARPEVGARAAVEDDAAIRAAIGDADMVFVTAGMGGGTGTGAAPVVARIARELGALTVGVVTRPFRFEGRGRSRRAEAGLIELALAVDTLIVIPNDRLLEIAGADTTLEDGFRLADSVLLDAVRSMADIIKTAGLINVDFADVVTVMQGSGLALMGTGIGSGSNRARDAARAAISSPLLEGIDIARATGLLVNISGGKNMTLREVNEAMMLIQDAVHEETETIFGAVVDTTLGDDIRITVVATGLGNPATETQGERPTIRLQPSDPDSRVVKGQASHVPPPPPGKSAAPMLDPQRFEAPPLADVNLDLVDDVETPTYVFVPSKGIMAEASVALRPPQASVAAVATVEKATPPTPQRGGLSEATAEGSSFDSPAFVRTSASRGEDQRRLPVMRNPFSDDDMATSLDTPAYLRR